MPTLQRIKLGVIQLELGNSNVVIIEARTCFILYVVQADDGYTFAETSAPDCRDERLKQGLHRDQC